SDRLKQPSLIGKESNPTALLLHHAGKRLRRYVRGDETRLDRDGKLLRLLLLHFRDDERALVVGLDRVCGALLSELDLRVTVRLCLATRVSTRLDQLALELLDGSKDLREDRALPLARCKNREYVEVHGFAPRLFDLDAPRYDNPDRAKNEHPGEVRRS